MPHDHVQKIKILTPPQSPRGRGPQKNCTGACAIHVSNSHTKSGWISEKIFLTQTPTLLPSPTPGHDPGARMKIPSDMLYNFHLLEDTQSLV